MGFLSLRQETVLYVFVLDLGVQEDIVNKMLGVEEEGGGGGGERESPESSNSCFGLELKLFAPVSNHLRFRNLNHYF